MRQVLARSLVMLAVGATVASAQTVTVKEEKAGMLKLATITSAAATATALTKVRGGKVQSAEIEKEGGKLVYSFDIKVAGKSGIDEVLVDAMTGAVISVVHETAAEEAKEAKEDRAKLPTTKVLPVVKKPGA